MSAPRVIIVGAGIIGLYCAWRLAHRGARVTVLEAEREDWGAHGPAASLAAAGMLAPISEMASPGEHHPELDALCLASFDLWRKHHAGALWADGVRFDGAVFIAENAAKLEALAARAAAQGRSAVPLTRAQWRKRTGIDAPIEHALFIEHEGVAAPERVMSGLVMELRRRGVALEFNRDVETIEAEPQLTIVAQDRSRYEAEHVVLAPGAWAHERLVAVAPALAHVQPAKGHLVPVETATSLPLTIRGPGFYLATRAGETVLGSTTELGKYDRRVDRAQVRALLEAAWRTLPGLVRQPDDAPAWAGVRPMSPDGAPLIGRSGAALVSCGHSRNGWLLAPVSAEIICAHVFGEELPPLWAAFDPARFDRQA